MNQVTFDHTYECYQAAKHVKVNLVRTSENYGGTIQYFTSPQSIQETLSHNVSIEK